MNYIGTLLLSSIVFGIIGCGGSGSDTSALNSVVPYTTPTRSDIWQYQLTGDLNLSTNATVYDIDMEDTSAQTIQQLHQNSLKVICYFSAGSSEEWRSDFDLFNAEDMGNDLDGWDGERWLDIRSENVHAIMLKRLDRAKEKGCDGVEADNVDGFINNTGFDFTAQDQLEYNRFLAKEAHARGLSIGLKNDLLQVEALVDDFDFAVNEECFGYNECHYLDPFIRDKKPVFNVEYDAKNLDSDAMTQLCNRAKALGFSTNILPLNLDGSYRYNCNDYLFTTRNVGFGGADSFKFHDNIYMDVADIIDGNYSAYKDSITDFNETAFNTLHTHLTKSKYIFLWLTKEWQESWFNTVSLQHLMDEGKIPVFIYWYFGDHLQEQGYLEANHDTYLQDVQRLGRFLAQFHGDKMLILEPEFNKNSVIDDAQQSALFVTTISDAIDTIKQYDPNIFISLAMMDTGSRTTQSDLGKCGYEYCALGDKTEWSRVDTIYTALLDKLDFISFEQMVAQFSRDPLDPGTWDNPNPVSYTDDEIGIAYLAQRIDNLAVFLHQRYNKPVMMPYIAIATATWNDANNDGSIQDDEIDADGWEDEALHVYETLHLQNLFGFGVMELFDNPTHDLGGYQFFIDNEYHLGIVKGAILDQQRTGAIEFKTTLLDAIFK